MLKRWFGLLGGALVALSFVLLPVSQAAAYAAQSTGVAEEEAVSLSVEAKAAAAWLSRRVPQPAPGDELAVFALLRSGTVSAQSPAIQAYAEQVQAQLAAGGHSSQSMYQTGWQLLSLAAAGADVTESASAAVEYMANEDALMEEGSDSAALALLLFGPAGVPAPEGFDSGRLVLRLLEGQDAEGSIEDGRSPRTISTARALQALAFYRTEEAAEAGAVSLWQWLQAAASSFGGFDIDGAPSALATAEAILALYCLREEQFAAHLPSPGTALLVFQNGDGSFSANPDSEPNAALTAQAVLALTAHARLTGGASPLFQMKEPAPQADATGQTPEGSSSRPGGAAAGGFRIPMVWIWCALGAVVAIVVFSAVVSSRRQHSLWPRVRRKAERNAKEPGGRHAGTQGKKKSNSFGRKRL